MAPSKSSAQAEQALQSPWEILSRIDVSEKIEKKNGMSYLSWAWAWGKLKEHYPGASFTKHTRADGVPYFMDMQGYAFVTVTVALNDADDSRVTETFPVLDHRNKPIQGPTAFDVNNALQRCLTKAIAYLGLGHYIYAGEDLPEAPVHGQDASGVATPTPPATSPSAGAFSKPAAMSAPDGTAVDIATTATDTIEAVFSQFIHLCTGMEELNGFYKTNKEALQYLKAASPEGHERVIALFAARKKEITQASQQGDK